MSEKKTRQEVIDELMLMLLYLIRFPDGEGKRYDEIAWKNYDFDAIDRLDEQELIYNPKRRTGDGCKYAYLTEAGRAKARDLLQEMNIADYDLLEQFEFRYIRSEDVNFVNFRGKIHSMKSGTKTWDRKPCEAA